MATPRLPTALRYGSYVLTLLSFVYIGKIVAESSLSLPVYTARTWAVIAAACVAYAVFPFISAWAWKLSVELVSRRPMRFDEAFGIYLKSNIAKYLPGNVLQYVGRNYLGAEHGWPHRQLALGSVVEVITLVAVPFAVLFAFYAANLWTLPVSLALSTDALPGATTIAVIALALVVAALVLRPRLRGLAQEARELLRAGASRSFAAEAGVFSAKIVVLLLVGLFGQTALFYLIASSLVGLDLRGADFINVGCSLTIAGYAGILTPGVPGGIGVRESISVILLSAYGYDKGAVAMAALLARLLSIAGDAIAFVLAMKFGRRPA